MSLSQALNLHNKTMRIEGFVDVDPYTPEKLKSTQATHAMVLMYRPLQGEGYQVSISTVTQSSFYHN